jgi:GGDEF domain-containing protein
LKVWIAEHNPGFRLALDKLQNMWGYDVVTAANGLEGWEMFGNDGPAGHDPAALLHQADEALYLAERKSRNRLSV